MSGLDLTKDKILEIACIITDGDLTVIAESDNIIVNQSRELLDGMNEWCSKTHREVKISQQLVCLF